MHKLGPIKKQDSVRFKLNRNNQKLQLSYTLAINQFSDLLKNNSQVFLVYL
jgi:hypothetical protein